MKNLLILGAGQYGMVVEELARSLGFFDEIEFLDDNNPKAIGKLNDYKQFADEYANAVVAIGNVQLRLELITELEKAGFNVTTIIHNSAYISPSAIIGKGSVIEPLAVIQTGASVGIGSLISSGAIINHNAVIGEGCHIDCGTVVGARAVIAPYTNTEYGEIITKNKGK